MIPDEFLERSHVRTPNGPGLSIAVQGDLRIGLHQGRPATALTVVISPASRRGGSGFRLARTVQYADGSAPKRTLAPEVHATVEDAVAAFRNWADRSATLNLPAAVKREHLKEGAFFYGGRYGDWLHKVIAVPGDGQVRYATSVGPSTRSEAEFLAFATTPATAPDPEAVAEIEATLAPGWSWRPPPRPDPFRGAVRREGALDWQRYRYTTEAPMPNGNVWATEESSSEGDLVSLFRRDSTPQVVWKPDERNAVAVARSEAEAWILAELLQGSSGTGTEPSEAYVPTYVDGERRGWVRKTETGHLTLHQGSDQHPGDVVVTQFSSQSPYEVMHVAWLKVPRPPWGGEGPWDRGPIRDADLMGAALALTELLIRADRLGRPLDDGDWKAWQHGMEIDPGKPAPGWNPPARAHGCPRDPAVVEAALDILEADPNGRSDLYEAGKEALLKLLHPSYGPEPRELPFALIALSRDVSAQYTLAADLLGKEKADVIARPAHGMTV